MAGPFDPPSNPVLRRGLMPEPPAAGSVETVTVVGASGTQYVFEIDAMGTAYHERSGVYMLLGKLPDGRWGIAYIGETDNFDRRLHTELQLHHRWQCVRAKGATHLGTLHVVPGGMLTREVIETDLRRAYDPPCNRQ